DLGLLYLVLMSLGLGLMFHLEPAAPGVTPTPQISWIGATMLMFAAILPSSPRRTLFAGLVAASMNPLSMLILQSRDGWHRRRLADAVFQHYPDYILVAVAMLISHVVN